MVNSPTCTSDPIEWTTIILTMFATNASWWLLEIPLLFSAGPKTYFKSVGWQCLRNHACGLAHLYAMTHGENAHEWAYLYYIGPSTHDANKTKRNQNQSTQTDSTRHNKPLRLTTYQFVLHALADTLSLIAAGMSISQAVATPAEFWTPERYGGVYNVFIWIYPTVPIALTGVFTLLCSLILSFHSPSSPPTTTTNSQSAPTQAITASSSTRKATWIALYAVLVIGAIAILIPTQFLSPAGQKSFLPLTIIAYILMASPLAAVTLCCGGVLAALSCVGVALLVRMLGVVMGALVSEFYFPFCALKGSVPFAAAYGAVGVIGAGFAVWARFKFLDSADLGFRRRRRGGGAVQVQYLHEQGPVPRHQTNYYDGRRLSSYQSHYHHHQGQVYQLPPYQFTPQPTGLYHHQQQQQPRQQWTGGYQGQQQWGPPASPPQHTQQQPGGYGWNVASPQQWSAPAGVQQEQHYAGWGK